ncbi:MAG: ornithine cyclodeaminase family protein [Acidimicrobiales bacterium]
MPWVSGEELFATLSMERAIRAIQRDLLAGLDPAHDLARVIDVLDHGQLLYMPSRFGEFVGAKVSTVAPANPANGLDRIHGVYVLFDAVTLAPVAMMDGQALTALRTPAVSAAVADHLAPEVVEHLVVFGSGTQAWGHVEAVRVIRDVTTVSVVARDPRRSADLVDRLVASGQPARLGSPSDVASAEVIVTATTARTPLFDGAAVPTDALVVAVGSHEPDVRELDATMIARSQVVVEDPAVALREAGDVIMAIGESRFAGPALVAMRDVLTGTVAVDRTRPRVFKSSGMPWEDLVVAAELHHTHTEPPVR